MFKHVFFGLIVQQQMTCKIKIVHDFDLLLQIQYTIDQIP